MIEMSDLNAGFRSNNSAEVITGQERYNQQIQGLILCELGSRPKSYFYGTQIMEKLFEPVNQNTAYEIENDLYDAIRTWMPQIKINHGSSYVSPLPSKEGYLVRISYYESNESNLRYEYVIVLER